MSSVSGAARLSSRPSFTACLATSHQVHIHSLTGAPAWREPHSCFWQLNLRDPLLECHCRYYGLKPDIKVISPWREWDLTSRSKLISYAESKGIAVPQGKRNDPPFSTDANLLHISYEG